MESACTNCNSSYVMDGVVDNIVDDWKSLV